MILDFLNDLNFRFLLHYLFSLLDLLLTFLLKILSQRVLLIITSLLDWLILFFIIILISKINLLAISPNSSLLLLGVLEASLIEGLLDLLQGGVPGLDLGLE